MLAVHYAEASGAGFDLHSPLVRGLPDSAFFVETERGADKLEEMVCLQFAAVHETGPEGPSEYELDAYVADVKAEYYALDDSVQRAAMIMLDHTALVSEFGSTSPQAKMAREMYAAAALAAALDGHPVPPLEQLYTPIKRPSPSTPSTADLNAVSEIIAAAAADAGH